MGVLGGRGSSILPLFYKNGLSPASASFVYEDGITIQDKKTDDSEEGKRGSRQDLRSRVKAYSLRLARRLLRWAGLGVAVLVQAYDTSGTRIRGLSGPVKHSRFTP